MSLKGKKILMTAKLLKAHPLLSSTYPEIKEDDVFLITNVWSLPISATHSLEGVRTMVRETDHFEVSSLKRGFERTHWCLFTNQRDFIFKG